MSVTNSATLSQLLDQALALPVAQRTAWVDALGPEHAAIKPRLRSLVARSCEAEGASLLDTLPKLDDANVQSVERFGLTTHSVGEDVGPYRLLRSLGAGAMGAVWLARESTTQLEVALKFAHMAPKRSDLLARLSREHELLAALDHPNIARIYTAGVTSSGQPYLVLEYVPGEALDAHCRARPLALEARLLLFLQVVSAVAHAHERSIVHRDLKPANVIVSSGGRARLLDFGIGKLLADGLPVALQLSEALGRPLTPAYASPEQVLGEPAEFASDIYSLGVMLYELLTGVRPYECRPGSGFALRRAILEGSPRPPSERSEAGVLQPLLRGELDALVMRALQKRPSERHGTAEAFGGAVERAMRG